VDGPLISNASYHPNEEPNSCRQDRDEQRERQPEFQERGGNDGVSLSRDNSQEEFRNPSAGVCDVEQDWCRKQDHWFNRIFSGLKCVRQVDEKEE